MPKNKATKKVNGMHKMNGMMMSDKEMKKMMAEKKKDMPSKPMMKSKKK